MESTFMGIEIGKRSLVAHNQGLNTTGHNLANASTEGYSRQRVELSTFDPLYQPQLNREETPGQIGQGVTVSRIERVRDMLLEFQIVGEGSADGYWSTRDNYILMLEQIYNEPTDLSARSRMDKFWEAWQELSVYPESLSAREAVVSRGQGFIDSVHDRFQRLSTLRDILESDIQIQVKQVNQYAKEIAGLNEQIVKVKAMGDNPNDLLDRRDLLIEKLSKIINISIDDRDPDEYQVHTDGLVLVQGKIARGFTLATDENNDGYSKVIWNETKSDTQFSGGSLHALFDLRDGDVRDEIQTLDQMALNFTDLVNEVHSEGYGLNGQTGIDFFVEYPYVNNLDGNYDANGDGEYDSTFIHRITGNNTLSGEDQIGIAGTMRLSGPNGLIDINYESTDTVNDVLRKINNSGAEVSARLDREGKIQLRGLPAAEKGNRDFVIRHVEDSGLFLSGYAGILNGSGQENAFTSNIASGVNALREDSKYAVAPLAHPSGWMDINKEIKTDLTSIATGFGINGKQANVGDGSAALAIAALRNTQVMVGAEKTFDDHFADAVARIGLKGEQSGRELETTKLVLKNLTDMRESISGVNMDEEFSNMIKFQHGYNAAAKYISTVNEMLDTIINRLGV